jgi:hypothetical protein
MTLVRAPIIQTKFFHASQHMNSALLLVAGPLGKGIWVEAAALFWKRTV